MNTKKRVLKAVRRSEKQLDQRVRRSQSDRARAGKKPTAHCRALQRKKATLEQARKRIQRRWHM